MFYLHKKILQRFGPSHHLLENQFDYQVHKLRPAPQTRPSSTPPLRLIGSKKEGTHYRQRGVSLRGVQQERRTYTCEQKTLKSRSAVGEGYPPARRCSSRNNKDDPHGRGGNPGLDLPPVHGPSQAPRCAVEAESLLVQLIGFVHQ